MYGLYFKNDVPPLRLSALACYSRRCRVRVYGTGAVAAGLGVGFYYPERADLTCGEACWAARGDDAPL